VHLWLCGSLCCNCLCGSLCCSCGFAFHCAVTVCAVHCAAAVVVQLTVLQLWLCSSLSCNCLCSSLCFISICSSLCSSCGCAAHCAVTVCAVHCAASVAVQFTVLQLCMLFTLLQLKLLSLPALTSRISAYPFPIQSSELSYLLNSTWIVPRVLELWRSITSVCGGRSSRRERLESLFNSEKWALTLGPLLPVLNLFFCQSVTDWLLLGDCGT